MIKTQQNNITGLSDEIAQGKVLKYGKATCGLHLANLNQVLAEHKPLCLFKAVFHCSIIPYFSGSAWYHSAALALFLMYNSLRLS